MRSLWLIVGALLVFLSLASNGQTVSSGGGTGAWSDPNSWTPTTVPTNLNTTSVVIQTGHTITVTDSRSIDQLTVNGTLVINSGNTLTIANATGSPDATIASTGTLTNNGQITVANGVGPPLTNLCQLNVNGRFNNNGAFVFGNASSRLAFGASAVYDHRFTTTPGTIPGGANTAWNATSTCMITGYTTNGTPPTNLGQSFGHFIWDTQNLDLSMAAEPNVFDLNGALTNVQGNLTVLSTGSNGDALFLTRNPNLTMASVDSLKILGGVVALNGDASPLALPDGSVNITCSRAVVVSAAGALFLSANTASASLAVAGDIVNEGILDLAASSGVTTINLQGNLIPGDTLSLAAGAAAEVNLNFIGTNQNLMGAIRFYSVQAVGNVHITAGDGNNTTVLNIGSNYITTNGNVRVREFAEMHIANGGYIIGTGNFTVENSAVLGVGSSHAAGAIQNTDVLDADCGNILTATGAARFFDQGSQIVYNGTSAQFMGTGHPSTVGVATMINNTAGVSLASNVTVSGALILAQGNLTIGVRTLTMNDFFSASNPYALNVSSTSSINIGVGNSGTFGTLRTTGSTSIANFTFNRNGQTMTLGNSLTITGTFTHDGGINLPDVALTIMGPYVATSGSLTGNVNSTLVIGGSGSISGDVPLSGTLGTLTINRAVGVTNTTSITIGTALNILSGTYQGSGSVTLNPNVTLTRGDGVITKAITASTFYNLHYISTAPINTGSELITSPSTALNDLTINSANSVTLNAALTDITVNGTLRLSGGSFISNGKGVFLNGPFVSNATGTFTGSLVTFIGSTTLSGGVPITFDDIKLDDGASLNLGSATVTITGDVDSDNGGSWTAGTGTVHFGGNTVLTFDVSNTPRFNNLTIDGSSTLEFGCNTCGSEGSRASIEVAGAWNSNNSGAVFTPAPDVAGNEVTRVRFTGANQSISTLVTHSFWDLTLAGTGTVTLSQPLSIANDLTLEGSKSLSTGAGNQALSVGGDFLFNGGSFTPNQGTVSFTGTAAQTIDRLSGSGPASFYNITVNKAGGTFTNAMDVNLLNIFTVSSNTAVDFDGPGPGNSDVFTLSSTISRTAVIGPIVSPANPAIVTGNVTAQRYMDGEGRIYRYISSPVLNPQAVDLQREIPITGSFTGTSYPPQTGCTGCAPCTGCDSNNQSMFLYTENMPGSINARYTDFPVNINTETIQRARGYSVFVREASAPTTWNLRGVPNKGDQTFTVTNNNDGWNLVGNPYPAPLDWLAANSGTLWTRTNIDPTIYIWDESIGNYASYNRMTLSSANGGSRYIAVGQAFWVHGTGTPAMTAREGVKAVTQPTFFREGEPYNYLKITLTGESGGRDESLLHFGIDGATDGYDEAIDSYEFPSEELLSLHMLTAGRQRLSINAVETPAGCSNEFRLGLRGVKPGRYTVGLQEFDLLAPVNVYLVDDFTGTSVQMKSDESPYSFEVTADTASFGDNRFALLFSEKVIDTRLKTIGEGICNGTDGRILILSSQKDIQYYAELNNERVSGTFLGDGDTLAISISKEKLAMGNNSVRIMAGIEGCIVLPMAKQVSLDVLEAGSVSITLENEMLVSNYDEGNQWYYNDILIEDARGKYFTPAEPGIYRLDVKIGDCLAAAQYEYIRESEETHEGYIVIYPNPVTDIVTVRVKSDKAVRMSLVNSLGVQVDSSQEFPEGAGEKVGKFNMERLSQGVYLIHIQDGVQFSSKRIVKK